MICAECSKGFHKKCTGLSRDTMDAIIENGGPWTCEKCATVEERDYVEESEPTEEISEQVKGSISRSLKIMQWNADGLGPKAMELEHRIKKEYTDICAIQKTKLNPKYKAPSIAGYVSQS